jgi:hypothetical protein
MLERYLRTPAGILALIGVTWLLAAGAAVFATTQRAWFEGHVREKLVSPGRTVLDVEPHLTNRQAGVAWIRGLGAGDLAGLYETWIARDGGLPASAPMAMVWGDPEYFLGRARSTLVCGSAEQRRRALDFLGLSRHPGAMSLLERAAARAEARRSASDLAAARDALKVYYRELVKKGAR